MLGAGESYCTVLVAQTALERTVAYSFLFFRSFDKVFIKVVVSRLEVLLTIHAHLLHDRREHGQDIKKLCSGDLLGIYFVQA